jgi:ubiquinone/menaquinone biosynthesis C-methylase UbiE
MKPTRATSVKGSPERRDITPLIRSHWNLRAGNYDGDSDHGIVTDVQRRAWRAVLARVAGEPPRQVLDVGCGTGSLAILLAELGHTVTGIDMAAQMLEQARQKVEAAGVSVRLLLGNVSELSDADGTYDMVVARHVVWTLPDPARTLREWRRVVRPGGCLAIFEARWGIERAAEGHPRSNVMTALRRAAGRIIFYSMRPAQWGAAVSRRFHKASNGSARRESTIPRDRAPADSSAELEQQYAREHMKLPFYGGPSAAELVALLNAEGFVNVTIDPLMEADLWGEAPKSPRYLAVARR